VTAPPPLTRAFPARPPVTHMAKHEGERFAGPLCGQRALDGTSHARTTYTNLAERVTCKKCAKAVGKLLREEGNA
jgi:hypothetical protein